MSSDLVSVIVPVYKVEKYVENCLKSICGQTYSNLEIIIVDDGSPDYSIDICLKIAKSDKRIKIIRKDNGGLASARNAALDIASGKYIVCVDSDDWIESDMVESMKNDLEKYDVDMVACDFYIDYNGLSKYKKSKESEYIVLDRNEAMVYAMLPSQYYGFAWNKMYKRNLIGMQRYNENFRKGEDSPFTCEYINKCKKVIYHRKPLYHYRSDTVSITRSIFAPWKMSVLDSYKSIIKMLIENGYSSDIVDIQRVRYANQLLSLSINIVSTDMKKYKIYLDRIRDEMKIYLKIYLKSQDINLLHKMVYFCAMKNGLLLKGLCGLKKKEV